MTSRLLREFCDATEDGRGEWFLEGLSNDEEMAVLVALYFTVTKTPELERHYWETFASLFNLSDAQVEPKKTQIRQAIAEYVDRVGRDAVLKMLDFESRPKQ